MIDRRIAIAARHLELCESEQRVSGVPRERILNDHLPVASLGVRRGGGQRRSPIERIRILRSAGGRGQLRIHERASRGSIPLEYQPARAKEE